MTCGADRVDPIVLGAAGAFERTDLDEPGPTETVMTDVQFTDAALLFTESAMALSLAFEIAVNSTYQGQTIDTKFSASVQGMSFRVLPIAVYA